MNHRGHKWNFRHSGILKYWRTVNDFTFPLPLKAIYIYLDCWSGVLVFVATKDKRNGCRVLKDLLNRNSRESVHFKFLKIKLCHMRTAAVGVKSHENFASNFCVLYVYVKFLGSNVERQYYCDFLSVTKILFSYNILLETRATGKFEKC